MLRSFAGFLFVNCTHAGGIARSSAENLSRVHGARSAPMAFRKTGRSTNLFAQLDRRALEIRTNIGCGQHRLLRSYPGTRHTMRSARKSSRFVFCRMHCEFVGAVSPVHHPLHFLVATMAATPRHARTDKMGRRDGHQDFLRAALLI
jgi:hypothetical protein